MTTAVVIVAAGRGQRAGGSVPKQYARLGGAMLLTRTLGLFLTRPDIAAVQVVIHPDDRALYEAAVDGLRGPLLAPVTGDDSRQGSVLRGLEALQVLAPRRVLIHDAARPFTSAATIDAVLAALDGAPAAIAALPVTDTLKVADAALRITGTLPRAGAWRAQTPQGFHYAPILAAHRALAASGRTDLTDDAAVAEAAGLAITLVDSSGHNMKITTAEDLVMAERLITDAYETRMGQGFDVHRFTDGDHVWLCGVRVPHDLALEGHSDADVGLHALTDALLGAIGDGDIGQHFPPSDPQWKGAASHLFLADAGRRVAERSGVIVNVDVTLLCETPKIAPHRAAMRARIAEILGLAIDRVGVKATTTERLGFTGRKEGIAALAVASVRLPAAP
jgi:2-C-methyl-D-erythritol 4-phosphate cytidylyltransferase/2-C-methyl-D-erythritol 2,4-cyclodiphosphate synthase